jgi:hypothetical protein
VDTQQTSYTSGLVLDFRQFLQQHLLLDYQLEGNHHPRKVVGRQQGLLSRDLLVEIASSRVGNLDVRNKTARKLPHLPQRGALQQASYQPVL